MTFDAASIKVNNSGERRTSMRVLRAMMQNMDTREMPIYALHLVQADGQQLGLKLEATRGPVEILVVDRAEKPTSE